MKFNTAVNSALSALMLVTALAIPALADPAKIPNHPRVNQVNGRRENQRDRIQQGNKSGQLTNHERNVINRNEHGIHQEEKTMRREDNGHLTKADQHALNQQQNKESKQIYKFKHNDHTQPGVTPASPAAH